MSAFIEVQGAGVVFTTRKGPFTALRDIDLKIAKGEFVSLIGHSGCGKSTLLNLIAGLLKPTRGVLQAGDEVQQRGFAAAGVADQRDEFAHVWILG